MPPRAPFCDGWQRRICRGSLQIIVIRQEPLTPRLKTKPLLSAKRVLDIAGDQSEALKTDSGASGAGNLVISWDSEQRVVFQGFRPHDSMSASAYFIVAPTTQVVDIIWQRGDDIAYLGPDANVLKSAHTYEWLKQIGF